MYGQKFVEIIEKTLSERKIPKGDFYKACRISSSTFSQWRKGQFNPSSEAIQNVEKYLGISLQWTEKTAPDEGSGLSEDELEIIKLYRTRADQTAAKNAVEALLQALPSRGADE